MLSDTSSLVFRSKMQHVHCTITMCVNKYIQIDTWNGHINL